MPNEYNDRLCAYVDILGFGRLIERLRQEKREWQQLRGLLQRIYAPGPAAAASSVDFKAQSISDAVAMSVSVSNDGLLHLCSVLQGMTLDLLEKGYFVRGAIAKGRLYHDDKMVFGEALVDAFHMETQVVRFPYGAERNLSNRQKSHGQGLQTLLPLFR